MTTATANHAGQSEVAILARVLSNCQGGLPLVAARHILSLGFGEDDKARMHDLAVRNQEVALFSIEKGALFRNERRPVEWRPRSGT
jgi:hypothetical protein